MATGGGGVPPVVAGLAGCDGAHPATTPKGSTTMPASSPLLTQPSCIVAKCHLLAGGGSVVMTAKPKQVYFSRFVSISLVSQAKLKKNY